jgi:GMP synthase PP-ATPase subunit
MILKQVYYKINLRISLKPDGQLEKRHQIIGNTFIDVFDEESKKNK